MSYTDEQISIALRRLEENGGAVTRTLRELGYPKRSTLYRWMAGRRSSASQRAGGAPGERYGDETKAEALRLVAAGCSYAEAARRVGASGSGVVYHWVHGKTRYLERKAGMADCDEAAQRAYDGFEGTPEERIRQLELENDILRGPSTF